MQGKLGLSNLGQIVADLLKKVGYDSNMYDVTRLTVPEGLEIKDNKKVFYITGNEVSSTLLRTKPQANNSNQIPTSASDVTTP